MILILGLGSAKLFETSKPAPAPPPPTRQNKQGRDWASRETLTSLRGILEQKQDYLPQQQQPQQLPHAGYTNTHVLLVNSIAVLTKVVPTGTNKQCLLLKSDNLKDFISPLQPVGTRQSSKLVETDHAPILRSLPWHESSRKEEKSSKMWPKVAVNNVCLYVASLPPNVPPNNSVLDPYSL